MWILDSINDVEIKRPFLILWATLGAAFLLLAHFFSINALHHPLTYSLLGLATYLIWVQRLNLFSALLMTAAGFLSILMLPSYPVVFALVLTLAAGKIVFAEGFRIWKWLVAAVLFSVAFPIVAGWQQIAELRLFVPPVLVPAVHAGLLAFCAQIAFLPFQVRKDSVVEAFQSYTWNPSWEAYTQASSTVELYSRIKSMMRTKETTPLIRQDLEDYTERVIHECHRLEQMMAEISLVPITSLEQQISALEEKIESLTDVTAKLQYEQALHNKQKQLEQYEMLRIRKERLLAQITNYNSSLENVRLAYTNQDLQKSTGSAENIEMFMDLVKARAEGFSA